MILYVLSQTETMIGAGDIDRRMGTDDRAHEACRTLSEYELKGALEAGADVTSVHYTTLMIETCTNQGDHHSVLEDVRIWMIDLLLLHGAHINEPDPHDRETPLMAAAQDGLTRVVDHLLRRGADPTMVDCEGRTAAMCAPRRG